MRRGSLGILLLSAVYQFITNLLQGQTAFDHKYDQVIEKIGSLPGENSPVLILCRNDSLAGFFADFFEYLVQTLLEQISRVRALRLVTLSRFNQSVEIVE